MLRHSAVLMRDLLRAARSPRTVYLRVGVAALVLLYSLVSFFGSAEIDVGALGNIGHDRFVAFTWLLQATVAILAPTLVTVALQEEREEHTLELLAMTGLPPVSILFGKYGSRMILLLGVVLGATPALAVGLSIGGVGTGEMVGAMVATAQIGVILAVIAGYYAVHARSILGPLAATALWAAGLGLFLVVPWAGLSRGGSGGGLWAIPIVPDGWSLASLWLVPLWAPVLLVVVAMTILGFRLRLAVDRTGEVPREDSSEVAWNDRAVGLVSGVTVLFVMGVPAGYGALYLFRQVAPIGDDLAVTSLAVSTWVGVVVATLLYLQVTARYLEQADPWMAALGRLGRGLITTRHRWDLGSWILYDPVLTRELVTRPYGATTVGAVGVAVAWAVLSSIVWFFGLLTGEPRVIGAASVFSGALGIVLVYAMTVILGTSSFAEERRADTLPLLFTTPYSPARVVIGKAVAVLVRVLPVLWVSVAMTLVGALLIDTASAAFVAMSVVVTTAAATSATVAALAWSMLVAARMRPAGLAWPVVLATPFVGLFLAMLLAAFGLEPAVIVLFPWVPLIDDDQVLPQIIAAVVYTWFSFLAFGAMALRLRKWATAGL